MPGGHESEYYQEINQQMRDFFDNWPDYRTVKKWAIVNGRNIEVNETMPNHPPTILKFAISVNLSRKTLWKWSNENEEFGNTYAHCKSIQENYLIEKGLSREFNEGITKMMLLNHSDLKDKSETEIKTDKIEIVLPSSDAARL